MLAVILAVTCGVEQPDVVDLADPGRCGDVQPVRGGGQQVGLQDGRAETEPLLLLVLQCKVEAQTEDQVHGSERQETLGALSNYFMA